MKKNIFLILSLIFAVSNASKAQYDDINISILYNFDYVSYDPITQCYTPFDGEVYNISKLSIYNSESFTTSNGAIHISAGETDTEITLYPSLSDLNFKVLSPTKEGDSDKEGWYMWEVYICGWNSFGSYQTKENAVLIKDGDCIKDKVKENPEKFLNIIKGNAGFYIVFAKVACLGDIKIQKNPVYMVRNEEYTTSTCSWAPDATITIEEEKNKIGDYISYLNKGLKNKGYTIPEENPDKYYAMAVSSDEYSSQFWDRCKNVFASRAVEVTPDTKIDNKLLEQLCFRDGNTFQIAIGQYIDPGKWSIPIHYEDNTEEPFSYSSDKLTFPKFNKDGASYDCFIIEERDDESGEWGTTNTSWTELYFSTTNPETILESSSLENMWRIIPKKNHNIVNGFCNNCSRHFINSVDDWTKLWSYDTDHEQWNFEPQDGVIVFTEDLAFDPSITYEHPLFSAYYGEDGKSAIIDGQNHVISNFHTTNTLLSNGPDYGESDSYAQISNLNFVDFQIDCNISNIDKYVDYEKEEIIMPIISENNSTIIKNCTFKGNINMDDNEMPSYLLNFSNATCLIYNNDNNSGYYPLREGTISHVLYYNEDGFEEYDANKATYIVKQTIGVGRSEGKGTVKKVAVKKNSSTNKAVSLKDIVYDKDSKDLNDDLRYFTDEQLASGEVAYWLNYEGKGYTGDFTRTWTQGSEVPEMTTPDSSNATHQLTYKVANGSNNVTDVTPYANEGSAVRISLSKDPESVTVDGTPAILSSDSEDNVFYADFTTPVSNNGEVEVEIVYEAGTGIKNETADNECNVREENGEITADCDFQIFSLMGQDVTSLNGKLSKGIYLVKCAAGTTTKVIVK